jgi:hypothetical protein
MTPEEIQKRNGKANNIRVIQTQDGDLFASSEEGMILYRVSFGDGKESHCTCGDYSRGSKNDPNFKCKHLLAIMSSERDVEKARILERAKPKLDERFIIQVDGQDFCKYQGLLDLAHQKFLSSLDVEILQYPSEQNGMTVICKAKAQTATGDTFSDIGDACPLNCNSRVAKHLIRMASTRAKARCLRDMDNIGYTALEELGDLDEVIQNEQPGTARKDKVKPFPRKIVKDEATVSQPGSRNGNGTRPADPGKGVSTSRATVNQEVKEPAKEAPRDEKKDTVENQPTAKGARKSGGNGQKAGDNGKSKKTDVPAKMSEAQKRAVYNLSRRRGISVEELEKMSKDSYGVPLENLSASDASSFIRQLQQSA